MADKAVGANIRRFREARGMLQKDLADKVGKNKNTISNWELGRRDPGADNLRLLAAALEISPSELIGHNETVKQDNRFEIIVTDDSMEPDIKIGDRIKVLKTSRLNDGDIVVADLDDAPGFAPVVRRWVHIGDTAVLVPRNMEYPYATETEFSVRGKAVELVRKI